MADCSFSRCIQQRRNIRRELQRWTKNMVHIVGLERIAEELMGRRKWKLYQESMSRSYLQPLNNNIKRTNPQVDTDDEYHHQKEPAKSIRLQVQATEIDLDKGEVIKTSNKQQEQVNGIEGGGEKEKEQVKGKEEYQKENENDIDRLKDWTPQTKCHFCVDGKLDSEHTTHGVLSPRLSDSDTSDSHSDGEVPTSLLPTSRGLLNNHHHRSNIQHPLPPQTAMTTIENMSMAALAVAALSGGPSPVGTPTPNLSFYNPAILNPNWYLASVARSFQTVAALNDVEKSNGGGSNVSGEQPLDLSKGSVNNNSPQEQKMITGNHVRLPPLDSRHIFKAKPRMSAVAGRRTYTEDELQAALRDIQSGKLGTRRAAVIYGIPRSTLRNKVYKLALEKERESHLNSSSISTPIEEEVMEDEKDLSGSEEEKAVERVLETPLLSMDDLFRFTAGREIPDTLKTLLQKGTLDQSEVPYLQNFLIASQSMLPTQKPPDGSGVSNMIPELMKRMIAEEQFLKMQNNGDSEKITAAARPSPSNSVITKGERTKSESDMETDDSPSNVILKIPSFKPTTSSKNGCDTNRNQVEPTVGSIISPPVTSESGSPPILPTKGLIIKDVKDVIAQSISQKFQQTMEPRRPMMDIEFKRGGFTPPLGSGISVIKTQHDLNRQFQQQQQPPKPQQSSNSAPTGGKGTRPKRGKYRNYDRDSLVEAVRAVQRGEMSVHRAGSYYGVPHSTLEYKVKERHLMRPRKRDPKPNPVDEKIASLKQNDIRNSQDKMKPMMKPPQKFSPTSPNGMKLGPLFEPGMAPLGSYNAPPFPFWAPPGFPPIPLDYARAPTSPFPGPNPSEFFASQMMQKLQEDSSRTTPQPSGSGPTLSKNARQRAESLLEGTATNGSFLDGIIRSSLESGVPNIEEKSSNEEKNVAPENMSNKALLDQLCRNSRLTPLSKPIVSDGNHSSEDESCRKSISPLNFATGETSRDDNNDDDSSSRYDKDSSEVHTIELSNDSNTSSEKKVNEEDRKQPRIYLKQDLVKPENLKPEMLVRFRGEVLSDMDHNGMAESAPSSASETDGPQD